MNKPLPFSRTHPIAIFFYLYRFLYLLLFPLLRGVVSVLTGGLLDWLAGAWMDILIILLMVGLAVLKWSIFQYSFNKNGLNYTEGIFFRQEGFIPMKRICTLSTQQPFWMVPLKIKKLRVDTLALSPNKADLILYLSSAAADQIMALRRRPSLKYPGKNGGSVKAECRPRLLDIVFLSLFTSNSFIGILFISAFISQSGKILGNHLSEFLISVLSNLARQLTGGLAPLSALLTFAFRLPPIATGIAMVLLGGWLIAFLLTLLQTQKLHTSRTKNALHIKGGVLVRKEYSIYMRDLSFIDVRQSLMTRCFRLYSVFLSAIGTGKERSDISALIPFSSRKRCEAQLRLLLPEYVLTPRMLRPNGGAIMKFLIDPLWPCILVPVLTFLGSWLLPMWGELIRFAGLMLSFPAFWFLGVRLMDFLSSGLSRSGDYYTMRYSNLYYLHTVVFSREHIALVNVRQSILQRGDNKCDLVVSTRSEGSNTHHIRNLDWDPTLALFDAVDPIPFYLKPSWFDALNRFFKTTIMKKKPSS